MSAQVAACSGKLAHRSAAAAWRELTKMRKFKNGGAAMSVYRCGTCHLWHIGRDNEGKKT